MYIHIITLYVTTCFHITGTSGTTLDTTQMTSDFSGGACRHYGWHRWHNTSDIMDTWR